MENNFSLQYNDFLPREEVQNKYNKNNLNELSIFRNKIKIFID